MVVIFGPDERSLNDVQVSSCHCHCCMTAETERQGQRSSQTLVTDGDDISLSGHVQTFELFILERCISKTF